VCTQLYIQLSRVMAVWSGKMWIKALTLVTQCRCQRESLGLLREDRKEDAGATGKNGDHRTQYGFSRHVSQVHCDNVTHDYSCIVTDQY
jgi:hypothetical protein